MIPTMRSIRVRLKPNNKQQTKLFQFAGTARFAYNWALNKQMTNFREGRKLQSNGVLRKEFTILRKSGEKPWLLEISNNVTKQAIKDCCNAYKRFFWLQKQDSYVKYSSKKLAHLARIGKNPSIYDMNGHPKFRSKKKGDFRFYQDTSKIQFTATHVKFEHIADSKRKNRRKANWIRLAERGKIPVNARYVNPRVSFDGVNWWLAIGIRPILKPLRNRKFCCKRKLCAVKTDGIGIDLGIKNLAIVSDRTIVKNINKTSIVKKLKKKGRRLQRQVSRKYQMNKKGERYCKTCNIAKVEYQLLRISQRLTNIRQNHIHQATTAMIKRNPSFVCLEDLNVQGMMKNKHLAKAVQEQKFYEFRRQMEYKAKWKGIPVVIADRFFPSSKTCICCGRIKKDLKLSDRIYKCECGNVIDRDLQAALNLKRYGERALVESMN